MTSAFNLGSYSEVEPSAFTLAPEDTFILTLDDWDEPVKSNYADRETGEFPLRVNLKFKIKSDTSGGDPVDDNDVSVKGASAGMWCNVNLNPNDKQSIWHVLVALDPDNEPKPGGSIEPYRGKDLKGTITHSQGKKDPTKTYANVINPKAVPSRLRGAEKTQKSAPARPNPLVSDDDDE